MRNHRLAAVITAIGFGLFASSASALSVTWMKSVASPGTPAKYDKVGVIKVGSPKAKNVIVFEPGTSAAAAYFVPLAKWITQTLPGWQVWAVQRRESLLEDQSEMNLAKQGARFYQQFTIPPTYLPVFWDCIPADFQPGQPSIRQELRFS